MHFSSLGLKRFVLGLGLWLSLWLTSTTLFVQAANTADIVSGATWTDTEGNVIQAHGAGMLKVDSTYYWFGEDKASNSALFHAVSCYTSPDLTTWTRQADALTPIAGTNISSNNIVERPKVIYNSKNSEYVMWFHSDSSNYGYAMVGVATATTPCGPYTYKASWKPLGADSRDMGLFQDDDETAYLLYASDNNVDFKIAQLDEDYYNVTVLSSEIEGASLEAPGVVKRDDIYYLFGSHTSGWAPNPNKFFTASSLSSTWSTEADIAPESTRTWYSQNAYDFPLTNSSGSVNAIYMGDRWRSDLLGSSRYIWYPLDWSSGSPQIVHADVWRVDLDDGTWTIVNGTAYEAEDGTLGGTSRLLSGSTFSGGEVVGYLGHNGTVTITVEGAGSSQWVALYYANGDSTYRNTTVSVNGGPTTLVDQPDSGGGSVVISVPVLLDLKQGSNTLTFGGNQTNYAGDLDKIIVYDS